MVTRQPKQIPLAWHWCSWNVCQECHFQAFARMWKVMWSFRSNSVGPRSFLPNWRMIFLHFLDRSSLLKREQLLLRRRALLHASMTLPVVCVWRYRATRSREEYWISVIKYIVCLGVEQWHVPILQAIMNLSLSACLP